VAVRVRSRIKLLDGRMLEATALVNTGFETEKPQLLLPVKAAEKLGLWPNLPPETRVEIYDTAGGPMRTYVISDAAEVNILTEDRESMTISSDICISHTEVEILISDMLAGRLRIVLEDPGEGIWRFRDDTPNKKRVSEAPQRWV